MDSLSQSPNVTKSIVQFIARYYYYHSFLCLLTIVVALFRAFFVALNGSAAQNSYKKKYLETEDMFANHIPYMLCSVPKQTNGYDCGIYCISYAEAAMVQANCLYRINPTTVGWEGNVNKIFCDLRVDAPAMRRTVYAAFLDLMVKSLEWVQQSEENYQCYSSFCKYRKQDRVLPFHTPGVVYDEDGSVVPNTGVEEKKEDEMEVVEEDCRPADHHRGGNNRSHHRSHQEDKNDEMDVEEGKPAAVMSDEEFHRMLDEAVDYGAAPMSSQSANSVLSRREKKKSATTIISKGKDTELDMILSDHSNEDDEEGDQVSGESEEEAEWEEVVADGKVMNAVVSGLSLIFKKDMELKAMQVAMAKAMLTDPAFYTSVKADFKCPTIFFNKMGKLHSYIILFHLASY